MNSSLSQGCTFSVYGKPPGVSPPAIGATRPGGALDRWELRQENADHPPLEQPTAQVFAFGQSTIRYRIGVNSSSFLEVIFPYRC